MSNATYRTEEYAVSTQDVLEIEWDGETRTLRTYTSGTADPLYVGNSLDDAAESLEVSRDFLDGVLMSDPTIRDAEGNIVDE